VNVGDEFVSFAAVFWMSVLPAGLAPDSGIAYMKGT
jgi:hypothetical protein